MNVKRERECEYKRDTYIVISEHGREREREHGREREREHGREREREHGRERERDLIKPFGAWNPYGTTYLQ